MYRLKLFLFVIKMCSFVGHSYVLCVFYSSIPVGYSELKVLEAKMSSLIYNLFIYVCCELVLINYVNSNSILFLSYASLLEAFYPMCCYEPCYMQLVLGYNQLNNRYD